MSYKTILVHVDPSRHLEARVATAARIANQEGAHLIGAAVTGISRFVANQAMSELTDPSLGYWRDELRQRANDTLDAFEVLARRHGVSSFEKRLVDDDAAGGLGLHARYCDLAVLEQEDRDAPSPALLPGFPEYVAMSSGTPALLVPYAMASPPETGAILVAWNASTAAMRAVRGALPLLARARMTHVAVFNASARREAHGEQPGADLALYLARHGIAVQVQERECGSAGRAGDAEIAQALLSLAADLDCEMLVMGCYGHSRFRETLLGGATRAILESMTLPVLMAH